MRNKKTLMRALVIGSMVCGLTSCGIDMPKETKTSFETMTVKKSRLFSWMRWNMRKNSILLLRILKKMMLCSFFRLIRMKKVMMYIPLLTKNWKILCLKSLLRIGIMRQINDSRSLICEKRTDFAQSFFSSLGITSSFLRPYFLLFLSAYMARSAIVIKISMLSPSLGIAV